MFSVKSFNKLVFFGITFFLVNSFFGADDAVRKPDDHAQVSNKLSTRSVQQDQENRSPNYSVEIVLPESVQKLKDCAQELLATIAQRKDVQEVTDQIVAAKDRLQDFLQEKLAIARPKLVTLGGDDEFGLQISAMALPFPAGSSGGGSKSSGKSQGRSSRPSSGNLFIPSSGKMSRPIVDSSGDKVRYRIHIGSNGYNDLDDIFDTRPQQRSAEELYKKRKLEEKIRDQEKQMQIMAMHQAEEQVEIVAWLQARILAEKDEEEAAEVERLKKQDFEKALLKDQILKKSEQTKLLQELKLKVVEFEDEYDVKEHLIDHMLDEIAEGKGEALESAIFIAYFPLLIETPVVGPVIGAAFVAGISIHTIIEIIRKQKNNGGGGGDNDDDDDEKDSLTKKREKREKKARDRSQKSNEKNKKKKSNDPEDPKKPKKKKSDNLDKVDNRKDLLPKEGDVLFEPKKQKSGEILRDKKGGYIDDHGNSWNWDPNKKEWDVVGKRGHRNVSPQGIETHRGTDPASKSGTSKSNRK